MPSVKLRDPSLTSHELLIGMKSVRAVCEEGQLWRAKRSCWWTDKSLHHFSLSCTLPPLQTNLACSAKCPNRWRQRRPKPLYNQCQPTMPVHIRERTIGFCSSDISFPSATSCLNSAQVQRAVSFVIERPLAEPTRNRKREARTRMQKATPDFRRRSSFATLFVATNRPALFPNNSSAGEHTRPDRPSCRSHPGQPGPQGVPDGSIRVYRPTPGRQCTSAGECVAVSVPLPVLPCQR